MLDGETEARRDGCGNVGAECFLLVIGEIGEKFVREFFGGFG